MKRNQYFKFKLSSFLCLFVLLSGCSSEEKSDRPEVYPVMGKIVFEGKNPKDAVVKLYKAENNKMSKQQILPRPKARVKEDGSFSIGTYGAGDGAPEGDYIITVSWKGDLKNFDDEDDSVNDLPELIPWEYTVPGQSKLRVTVKKEDENVIPEITIDS